MICISRVGRRTHTFGGDRRREPGYACPPGFNLGAQNLADYLQLPRTQAAIVDGFDNRGAKSSPASTMPIGTATGFLCVQLSEG